MVIQDKNGQEKVYAHVFKSSNIAGQWVSLRGD